MKTAHGELVEPLPSNWTLVTPYSSKSSNNPRFSVCPLRKPSCNIPAFCMTRPEAGLRVK